MNVPSSVLEAEDRAAYSPTEVATRLNISVAAVYQHIHAGHIPNHRLGRRFLIPAAYVRALAGAPDPDGPAAA